MTKRKLRKGAVRRFIFADSECEPIALVEAMDKERAKLGLRQGNKFSQREIDEGDLFDISLVPLFCYTGKASGLNPNFSWDNVEECAGCGLMPVDTRSMGRHKFVCFAVWADSPVQTPMCKGKKGRPTWPSEYEAIDDWNKLQVEARAKRIARKQ